MTEQTKTLAHEPETQQKAQQEAKKTEEKKEEKKVAAKEIHKPKKETAVVNGRDLRISLKQSISICRMIRGKTIECALKMLEEVVNFKRIVKMNDREIPHKHGKGVMAGRNPVKACLEFIRLLKQLRANAAANELEPEEFVVYCKANLASRPYRSGGRKAKATHITLKLERKIKKRTGQDGRKKIRSA